MIATHHRFTPRVVDSRDLVESSPDMIDTAEAELREALRLARGACELLDRAAPASGSRGHAIRIAQAISESLVIELEIVTGKGGARHRAT